MNLKRKLHDQNYIFLLPFLSDVFHPFQSSVYSLHYNIDIIGIP